MERGAHFKKFEKYPTICMVQLNVYVEADSQSVIWTRRLYNFKSKPNMFVHSWRKNIFYHFRSWESACPSAQIRKQSSRQSWKESNFSEVCQAVVWRAVRWRGKSFKNWRQKNESTSFGWIWRCHLFVGWRYLGEIGEQYTNTKQCLPSA